ncbi:transposase [Candidatus Kaiserbacteria bacterium RIFCSPLOWO2_01_FULL_53_17]|uniref:Transposase n=1 Tax=Candidatus Kaiserbacteria bacterium RIFCSPLOWO2_01_FULL_53_17 TaxID=1798511 RepID=A0A1F6EHU4_9BACT|nr:MAG: transposase [Candidatus Kaiserbacteria bacterium RIFCSPLOWO2_01_FULL_53_17]
MWCVPKFDDEYIERMELLLDLYALPYNAKEPVVCIDEKSKQLLHNVRSPLPMTEHTARRIDYEYRRNGTRNIFCAVEPKGGRRRIAVTKRRTKQDFAHFVRELTDTNYAAARIVHIVCDNLNTHFPPSFYETFEKDEADRILSRIEFHYTPKHASWLDMAEIELSILSRTAIKGRVPTAEELSARCARFQDARNNRRAVINWKFTTADARKVMKYEVEN